MLRSVFGLREFRSIIVLMIEACMNGHWFWKLILGFPIFTLQFQIRNVVCSRNFVDIMLVSQEKGTLSLTVNKTSYTFQTSNMFLDFAHKPHYLSQFLFKLSLDKVDRWTCRYLNSNSFRYSDQFYIN